jgi:hypothetical protein
MMTPTTKHQILVDCQQQCEQLKKKASFRWNASSSSLHAHFTRQLAAVEKAIDEADDYSMAVMTDMFIWSTYIEKDEEQEDEGSDQQQELQMGSSQRSNTSRSKSSSSKKNKKDDDNNLMKDSSRRSKTTSRSSSKKSAKSHAKRKEQRRRMKEELHHEIMFDDKQSFALALDATSKAQPTPPAA